ncbi:MAG: polyketide cyclase [Flammeovirgaceae bacterium]
MEQKSNRSLIISFVIGITFTLLGLACILMDFMPLAYGIFIALPLAIGVSSGILPDVKQAIIGTMSSLVVFGLIAYFTESEGLVCLLMAAPVLLLAIGIGWSIGRIIRKNKQNQEANLKVAFYPFLILFTVGLFEFFAGDTKTHETVSSSIVLTASPSEVYQEIIAVDTVDVPLNVWHKIGLPTPTKCILTEEKVGGLRLCLFKEGQIVEKITALEKDRLLRMDVTEFDLGKPRDWLEFDEDIYEIEPLASGQTKITRTTTYLSSLKPRWYWEMAEKHTIEVEQDFVFRNLIRDIQNRNE